MPELPTFIQLLRQLQRIPHLPSKQLYKIGEHFLHMSDIEIEQLCGALLLIKQRLVRCDRCFGWRELDVVCSICDNHRRDQTTICVVETWHDMLSIEKTQAFNGVYHILGGAIYPLEGIGPDDLTIEHLLKRVASGESIKEIIFANNPTPQGEATALYIAHKLRGSGVLLSCLARGLPTGGMLHETDRMTVYKALSERKTL